MEFHSNNISLQIGPDDDPSSSGEFVELMDFAYRLGSSNIATEPGFSEDRATHNGARLLMSLCASPPRVEAVMRLDAISTSESDSSCYASDSSVSRRESNFTFVCPSLSLEASSSPAHSQHFNEQSNTSTKRRSDKKGYSNSPVPAVLLGRTLTVDDRDALRLSADAMARNILHSFRKAITWRIEAWVRSLSSILVKKEKQMVEQGATEDELKSLLESSEAVLILKLNDMAKKIQVSRVETVFKVLPHRADKNKEPAPKKRRTDLEEDGDYHYSVAHTLLLDSIVHLQTPAGFSEVVLQVPGTIEGTFLCAGQEIEGMTSVVVDLDTDMLAAMIEKACRQVVRTSVEHSIIDCEIQHPSMESPKPQASPSTTPNDTFAHLTTPPPTREVSSGITAENVRTAFVTPREPRTSTNPTTLFHHPASRRVLRPIPDDFEDLPPRRISPQPNSPEPSNKGGILYAAPSTPNTNLVGTSALVSPPLIETTEYHEATTGNGPSLPMLVEIACREYRDT